MLTGLTLRNVQAWGWSQKLCKDLKYVLVESIVQKCKEYLQSRRQIVPGTIINGGRLDKQVIKLEYENISMNSKRLCCEPYATLPKKSSTS